MNASDRKREKEDIRNETMDDVGAVLYVDPEPYGLHGAHRDPFAHGAAGHPGRGGFFRPDPQEIADKAEKIEHRNHIEEKEMLEKLTEFNRKNSENNGH